MENTVTERSNRPGYGDDGRGVFFFPARVPFWLAPILCVGLLMAACSSPEQPRELTGAGSVVPADAVPVAGSVCTRWASTSGSDGNAGSQAAPYRSMNKLVTSLAPGEVGCLPANQTYYSANSNVDGGYGQAQSGGGTLAAPVVITSGPGGRASFKGQLLLGVATHDITLTGINFTGKTYANGTDYGYKGVHLILNGDRILVEDNDISDPTGICMQLGDSNQADPAVNVRVTKNLIHGCGMDPAINWLPEDSGAHGIYVQNTTGAEIDENLIYGNRTRGVQLYPRNDGVEVHHNLFARNATHVNVGSEGADVAKNSDIHDNLMTDRVKDWAPAKNESQVFGNMPATGNFNNQVRRNCYDPGDVFWAGNGLEIAADNTGATPTFVDAGNDDYTLTRGSACQGYGPASIQPVNGADVGVGVSAPASLFVGDVGVYSVTVTNGGPSSTSVGLTLSMDAPPYAVATTSQGSCAAMTSTFDVTCPLGDLGAGATATVKVSVPQARSGSRYFTARAYPAAADPVSTNNTATVTRNVAAAPVGISGRVATACTTSGTAGADVMTGTSSNDVLCGFGGADILTGLGGDDALIGGPLADYVSYSTAAGPVVANLDHQDGYVPTGSTANTGDDAYRGVERLRGSAYNDTLVGFTTKADKLYGLGGSDTFYGYGGNDSLYGAAGNDTIRGGDGDDSLYGAAGNDTLNGEAGNDLCDGNTGTNTLQNCER